VFPSRAKEVIWTLFPSFAASPLQADQSPSANWPLVIPAIPTRKPTVASAAKAKLPRRARAIAA
jgi:hypothetical protein